MPNRFLDSNRMRRAQSISDRKLLEFSIVSEEPLVVYCFIQGSSSDPYAVLIDLKNNVIAHWCPDFVKRRSWCKHLGKILLKLDKKFVDEIYKQKSSLNIEYSASTTKDLISFIKEKQVSEKLDLMELNLTEQIEIVSKLMEQKKNVDSILKEVKQNIKKDLQNVDSLFSLLRMQTLMKSASSIARKEFIAKTKDIFFPKFQEILELFYQSFWYTSLLRRLEMGYLIKQNARILGADIHFEKLKKPDSLSTDELLDANIVLELFLGDKKALYKQM
ncbi:MAG: hypothetical protein ACTSPI_16490, partial [Candidatus Heimdallarchaeaceae archaeon]